MVLIVNLTVPYFHRFYTLYSLTWLLEWVHQLLLLSIVVLTSQVQAWQLQVLHLSVGVHLFQYLEAQLFIILEGL